jgi:hypothetical protein
VRVSVRRLPVASEHRSSLETSRLHQRLELILRVPPQQPGSFDRLSDRAVLDELIAKGGDPQLPRLVVVILLVDS